MPAALPDEFRVPHAGQSRRDYSCRSGSQNRQCCRRAGGKKRRNSTVSGDGSAFDQKKTRLCAHLNISCRARLGRTSRVASISGKAASAFTYGTGTRLSLGGFTDSAALRRAGDDTRSATRSRSDKNCMAGDRRGRRGISRCRPDGATTTRDRSWPSRRALCSPSSAY